MYGWSLFYQNILSNTNWLILKKISQIYFSCMSSTENLSSMILYLKPPGSLRFIRMYKTLFKFHMQMNIWLSEYQILIKFTDGKRGTDGSAHVYSFIPPRGHHLGMHQKLTWIPKYNTHTKQLKTPSIATLYVQCLHKTPCVMQNLHKNYANEEFTIYSMQIMQMNYCVNLMVT